MPKFNELSIGQSASLVKTFSKEDVSDFAKVTGDFNPIHIDEEYSSNTRFGRCIVHGTFYSSIVGTILGTILPGLGTILVTQEHKFVKPVFVGDTLMIKLQIIELHSEKHLVTLSIECSNQNNDIVMQGVTIVKKP
jgi:acyl dehydratase